VKPLTPAEEEHQQDEKERKREAYKNSAEGQAIRARRTAQDKEWKAHQEERRVWKNKARQVRRDEVKRVAQQEKAVRVAAGEAAGEAEREVEAERKAEAEDWVKSHKHGFPTSHVRNHPL
jgi:hypothetical protein